MYRFSRSPASIFAVVFGIAYLATGIAGFAVTGFSGFASMDGPRLLGLFMVNPLHNLVHIAIAAVWLVTAPWHQAARIANLAIGTTLGLVTVLGFAHVLTFLSIHSLGDPDNFLHLMSATLALYFGSIGAERLATDPVAHADLGV
ncbi:MAG: DUF4383 domain-containing protein [Jatrophihabitantaceae bacterium]